MTFPVLTTKGFLIYPTITAAMQERTMFIVHKNHTLISLVLKNGGGESLGTRLMMV